MGDPPRDVRPRGRPLRGHELRHVVEGDDEALETIAPGFRRNPAMQGPFPAAPGDRDVAFGDPARTAAGGREEIRHLGNRVDERPARERFDVRVQQAARRAVGQVDPAAGIEADDTGRHAGKHRFRESSTGFQLLVGVDEFGALRLELGRHPVEGPAQRADLVVRRSFADADRQVAAARLLGRADQARHRPHQTCGERQREPDRGEQHEQRHDGEDQDEVDANARSLAFQAPVFVDGELRPGDVAEDLRVHVPADEEKRVRNVVEADQRPHAIVVGVVDDRHLAAFRPFDGLVGSELEGHGKRQFRLGENPSAAFEDDGFRQPPQRRLRGHDLPEPRRVANQGKRLPVQVRGHRQRVGANELTVLVGVRPGDDQGVGNRLSDGVAEPGLDAEIEEQEREHRDDDGGRDRDETEHEHQTGVQPRAGPSPAPLQPQPHQAERHDRAEKQPQDQIHEEQGEDRPRVGTERRRAGERDVGRHAGRHRHDEQHRRQLARQAHVPDPGRRPGERTLVQGIWLGGHRPAADGSSICPVLVRRGARRTLECARM